MSKKTKKIIGIYCIENLKNNIKYIGLSRNIEQRWKQHKYKLKSGTHNNTYLQNAWNKYGEDNFHFYILEECSQEELNNKEQHWINYYDTYYNGYNGTLGGEGYLTINPVLQFSLTGVLIGEYDNAYAASDATQCSSSMIYQSCNKQVENPLKYIWLYKSDYENDKTIIESYLEKNVYQYNLKGELLAIWGNLQEIRDTLHINATNCVNHKVFTCNNFIFLYKKDLYILNETFLEKANKKNYNRKSILKISLDGIILERFESIAEVRRMGYHDGLVIQCCNYKKDFYKKYIWIYEENQDVLTSEFCKHIKENYYKSSNRKKSILQYDLNNVFIKRWSSCREAHRCGYFKDFVRACCNGQRETYKGYIWRYEEECV